MTAFAFDILAALTGPGAKPGVAASGAQADGALGGAFEALLAGLVAQQQDGSAAAPTAAAQQALAPRIAAPLIADAGEGEAAATDELSDQDLALAGAEALVLPTAPAPEITVAAVAIEPEAVAAPVAVAAADASVDAAADVVPTAQATPAPDDRPLSEPKRPVAAQVEAKSVPTPDVPSMRKALPAQPEAGVKIAELVASAPSGAAPSPVDQPAAAAPADVARTAVPVAVQTPELVSLTARVVAPRTADPVADARTAREPDVAAPAADVAEPAEVLAEAVVAEPVEVAVEVPVAAEALVAEAVVAETVETPAPVAPAARRSTRADAAARSDSVIAADKVAALEPGLKTVAGTDASTTVDATPATDSDAVAAAPVVAEADVADDAAPTQAPVAQPTVHAAQSAAVDHAAAVRGSPETVAKLASDIVRKLEGQNTKFDLQLDPLGLGKVDVSVEINADGRLTAALSFETAQAADALRGRATELRQALEKAGFDLTDSSLSFDMNNQGGGAQRQQDGERFAAWSSRAFQSVQSGLDQADALLAAATYARSPNGGVDIRI